MASRSSSVAETIKIERVTDASADSLFQSKRQSVLPVYVAALMDYKVGDTGRLLAGATEEDRTRTTNFIRRAASKLGYGIKIVASPDGKYLMFRVKSRTVRARNGTE